MTRTSKLQYSDLFVPRSDVKVNQVNHKKLMRLRSLKSRQKEGAHAVKEISTEKYIRAKALFRNTVKSTTVNLMSLNSIEAKKRPGIIYALTGGENDSKNGRFPQKAATNQYAELSPTSFVTGNKLNGSSNVNGVSNTKANNSMCTNNNNNANNCSNCLMDTVSLGNNHSKPIHRNSSFKNSSSNVNNCNGSILQQGLIQQNNMFNRLTTKQSNSELSHLKNIECVKTEQLFSSNEELFIANVLLRHYLFHRATDEILNYLFSEIPRIKSSASTAACSVV